MQRRSFLTASAAGVAALTTGQFAAAFADKPQRVGLIGCGWYGKIDLLRLVQVAPVEVVSLQVVRIKNGGLHCPGLGLSGK